MRYELCEGYFHSSNPTQIIIICSEAEEDSAEPLASELGRLGAEYECINCEPYGFAKLNGLQLPALLLGERYLFGRAMAMRLLRMQQHGELIAYGTDYVMLQNGFDLIAKARRAGDRFQQEPCPLCIADLFEYNPADEEQTATLGAIVQYENQEDANERAKYDHMLFKKPTDDPIVLTPPDKPTEPDDEDLPF